MTKISVAICSYNGSEYIEEQLISILSQSLPVDEIVICDDGSTDATLNVIGDICKRTNVCIRVFCNETRLGVRANFQKAFDLCNGDLVFFSDQDDVWMPNKVETIVEYFSNHSEKAVVFTNGELIDGDGQLIDGTLWAYFFNQPFKEMFDRHLELECFLHGNHATGATMAMRSSFLKNNRFSDAVSDRILHDHIIALKAIENNCLGYIDQYLIKYRLHLGQQRGVLDKEMMPRKIEPLLSAFSPAFYVTNVLSVPQYVRRADFLSYRVRSKHHFYGPISILFDCKKYHDYYQSNCYVIMMRDIKDSFSHTLSRVKKKIFNR